MPECDRPEQVAKKMEGNVKRLSLKISANNGVVVVAPNRDGSLSSSYDHQSKDGKDQLRSKMGGNPEQKYYENEIKCKTDQVNGEDPIGQKAKDLNCGSEDHLKGDKSATELKGELKKESNGLTKGDPELNRKSNGSLTYTDTIR